MNEDKIIQKLENIENKLGQHDERFDKIDQRFDKIEQKLTKHHQHFDKVEGKLTEHDTIFDLLARKSLEHEENIIWIKANMATKNDLREITTTLDTLVGLAKKKDEEMTIMGHQMQLVQEDIRKIKPLVGLAV